MTSSAVILGMIGQAFLDLNAAYLIMMPEFYCPTLGGTCDNTQICQGENSPQIPYKIDYGNEFSLHNWVSQYDLICSSKR